MFGADMIFIPRKNVNKPALLVELKWDDNADSALQQIKNKNYTGALDEYKGNILLVGINYDKTNKNHINPKINVSYSSNYDIFINN